MQDLSRTEMIMLRFDDDGLKAASVQRLAQVADDEGDIIAKELGPLQPVAKADVAAFFDDEGAGIVEKAAAALDRCVAVESERDALKLECDTLRAQIAALVAGVA